VLGEFTFASGRFIDWRLRSHCGRLHRLQLPTKEHGLGHLFNKSSTPANDACVCIDHKMQTLQSHLVPRFLSSNRYAAEAVLKARKCG
jgi:hypothetical protein